MHVKLAPHRIQVDFSFELQPCVMMFQRERKVLFAAMSQCNMFGGIRQHMPDALAWVRPRCIFFMDPINYHTHIGTTELSAVGNLCDGGRVQFGRPETSG